ncbi:hypothetical protein ACJ6WJ_02800 [Stenotrophomonas maltophilia]|uniref:hypothetical protein n=1 Tax=Stenotrophomonas maltophilia TaxID=40324 RepID=UPI003896B396
MKNGIYNVHPMESPRYHLARANVRFRDIRVQAEQHANSGAFSLITETDPGNGKRKTVLRRTKRTPIVVGATVNDAFEELRKALDQACYAVAKAAGRSGKKCAFPFGETEQELAGRLTGISREIPKEIFAAILEFQPRLDGDKLLWAVNAVANHSKHRVTIAFPTPISSATISQIVLNGSGSILGPWNEDRGELMIAEVDADSEVSIGEMQFGVSLRFGDIEGLEGLEVEPVFLHAEAKVAQILDAIEEKAEELALFPS